MKAVHTFLTLNSFFMSVETATKKAPVQLRVAKKLGYMPLQIDGSGHMEVAGGSKSSRKLFFIKKEALQHAIENRSHGFSYVGALDVYSFDFVWCDPDTGEPVEDQEQKK